jgi:hypothetical protein
MRARRGSIFEFETPAAWSRFINLLVKNLRRKTDKQVTADDADYRR